MIKKEHPIPRRNAEEREAVFPKCLKEPLSEHMAWKLATRGLSVSCSLLGQLAEGATVTTTPETIKFLTEFEDSSDASAFTHFIEWSDADIGVNLVLVRLHSGFSASHTVKVLKANLAQIAKEAEERLFRAVDEFRTIRERVEHIDSMRHRVLNPEEVKELAEAGL